MDDRVRDPDTRMTERDEARGVIREIAEELEAKQGAEDAMQYFQVATQPVGHRA
ncbi:MAG: hypothetical protein K0R41_2852 [Geminicoccaceae bacterium]|nr:hypothetical protein [Geminicoccaceae bacterium]